MPRSKSGVKRAPLDSDNLQNAVLAVTRKDETAISYNEAARFYNVSKATLSRHVAAFRQNGGTFKMSSDNLAVRRVFSYDEEAELVEYIRTVALMHYGMSVLGVRKLAYTFALANGKTVPKTWTRDERAGEEWYRSFNRRFPTLSIQKPDATSLAPSMAFNRVNVGKFFDNLTSILTRFGPIPPNRIWNVDESGYSTVGKPMKIVAPKGIKQIGVTTWAERGQLVTLIAAINAVGGYLAPFLVFPRVNFKDFMLFGAPPGSEGTATPTGWSNEHVFIEYLRYFIKNTKPSKEDPVLLILDNHESHRSVQAVEFCRINGIILLTFPPHCTLRMQPLDTHCFGSFQRNYDTALSEWHLSNPGKAFTIYNVAEAIGKAFPRSFTPNNITHGFRDTGISPLDRDIYPDDLFAPASVTDQPNVEEIVRSVPLPCCEETAAGSSAIAASTSSAGSSATAAYTSTAGSSATAASTPTAGSSATAASLVTDSSESTPQNKRKHVSPEEVRPYPKAQVREPQRKKRKTGKTTILTDSFKLQELKEQKSKKSCGNSLKKSSHTPKKRGRPRKLTMDNKTMKTSNTKEKLLKKTKKIPRIWKPPINQSDSSDEGMSPILSDDSDPETFSSLEEVDEVISIFDNVPQCMDYVLVTVCGKTTKFQRHYIAQIVEVVSKGFTVKWFKRRNRTNKFVESDEKNSFVPTADIVQKLPPPSVPSASRFRNMLEFSVDDKFNMSVF